PDEGPVDGPFFTSTRPAPDRPLLVQGLGAVAILNGAGEASYLREARGAPLDWGGIYGQGVRLTGPWRTGIAPSEGARELGRATLVEIRHDPGGVSAGHRLGELDVADEWIAFDRLPAVERRLVIRGTIPRPAPTALELSFGAFLAPVLIEGVRPYEWRARREDRSFLVESHGFGLRLEAEPAPTEAFLGTVRWGVEPVSGEIGPIGLRWAVPTQTRGPFLIRVRVTGGLARSAEEAPRLGDAPPRSRAEGDAAWARWIRSTPELEFPDAPALSIAYRRARAALRTLYTSPGNGLIGLAAGFPWYNALWCRDMAWMIPALVWLGDFDWAKASVRTVLRFQAGRALPILGASAGELPMQVAPGPVFLFGTSDTTLYYPGLLRRLVDHTGDRTIGEASLPALERIVEWGMAKSDARTGLIQNGGEVAVMRHETEVGRVRVGFDAVDTTIWDSTDRRDHAIDVQVLWIGCLEAVADLARASDGRPSDRLTHRALGVRETVASRYAWPEEAYLFDSLRLDGTPVRKMRPNALRAVSEGIVGGATARAIVQRAARADLSAPWGLRTLSADDPGYSPIAYHDGQVWTIATAWAADAALRVGAPELGVRYLETIGGLIEREGGYANECYRGDRPEAFDSCFILGFSVAPFLSVLFERLWGIRPDLRRRRVEVRPNFPARWSSASLRGLRLGSGALGLIWSPRELKATWSGTQPITLAGPTEEIEIAPGGSAAIRSDPVQRT
ncbi:MAG TPA: amylo-alpha-1,6-glucosidase, partial [Thermoplasmata archaeon]|nr:amylo-alpha-1,6-glucosidase [Thermoplasmata archaeon]